MNSRFYRAAIDSKVHQRTGIPEAKAGSKGRAGTEVEREKKKKKKP